jgi:hypothetical protein
MRRIADAEPRAWQQFEHELRRSLPMPTLEKSQRHGCPEGWHEAADASGGRA